MTPDEIASELRRRGIFFGLVATIEDALRSGTRLYPFIELPGERWTLSSRGAAK